MKNSGKGGLPALYSLLLSLFFALPTPGAELRLEPMVFESHGDQLSGTLVFPAGKIHAAVVFVHGSGKQTRNLDLGERFARAGIAALVYDKRGVGKSGGEYEQNQNVGEKNLELLSDDAVAAVRAAAAHRGLKGIPVGLAGISQAGWIAPLAAQKSSEVKFLVLWSGPVCKVSEEDIYSKYSGDSDRDPVPSYAVALKSRKDPYRWPAFLGRDTDSAEDLAKLDIPGLWIFSDNDASIPVDLSIERLQNLRRAGKPYQYVLFSGHGHNNMEPTFLVATDWVRRKFSPD